MHDGTDLTYHDSPVWVENWMVIWHVAAGKLARQAKSRAFKARKETGREGGGVSTYRMECLFPDWEVANGSYQECWPADRIGCELDAA